MADIVERLKKKTRRHVLASMPPEATFLERMDLAELLIEYRTWRGQFIAPLARRVYRSDRLDKTELTQDQGEILAELIARIEAGGDLTPNLSSSVQRVPRPGRSGTRRDHLLSDWGIHHLHLSDKVTGDGFVGRTDVVLFAIFTVDSAYLIGVFGHPGEDNWAAREIFETIVRDWPDAGLAHEIKGVVGLSRDFTDEDYEKLRRSGLGGPIAAGGKVWLPGGFGQTLAGTPIEATQATNQLMWAFDEWQTDPGSRLAEVQGVRRGAYWIPWIEAPLPGFEEYGGFWAEGAFVPVGRIC